MNQNANTLKVTDSANWVGADLANDDRWIHRLAPTEISDLCAMAAAIRPQLENDPNRLLELPRSAFNIGSFDSPLNEIFGNLKTGSGLALIKGLPIAEMDLIDAAIVYWGIGLMLGDATQNNPDGDMFGHVTDLGKSQSDPNSRGYQTREQMDYHCDQSDMVALLCVRSAKSGGESRVASSVAMYNTLVQRHPEYAEALTQPLCWTKHGEHAPGEQSWYQSAVFNFLDGKLCTSFGPKHIYKGHDLPGNPPLSDLQRRAIEVAEEIADEQRCDMVLEPGDIQVLNNYVALHTRSAYEDFDEPEKKRLLWRLWLMNDDLRARTNYSRQWQSGVNAGGSHVQIRL